MDELRTKYLDAIGGAADEAALEDIRVQAVGKKGEVALKMRELGKMTPEERQVAGPKLNALKDEINSAIAAKKSGWRMQHLMNVCAPNGWTSPCRAAPRAKARSTRSAK